MINSEDPNLHWKLAKESNDVTQWINFCAVHASTLYIRNEMSEGAFTITHSLNKGMPLHFGEKNKETPHFMKMVAKKSIIHKMHMEITSKVRQIRPEWPIGTVHSLTAATLFHSADHFYTDKYCGHLTKSKTLTYDSTFLRAGLIGPTVYRTRKIRCVERLDDPICKIVFDAAMRYDPEFAKIVNFACAY